MCHFCPDTSSVLPSPVIPFCQSHISSGPGLHPIFLDNEFISSWSKNFLEMWNVASLTETIDNNNCDNCSDWHLWRQTVMRRKRDELKIWIFAGVPLGSGDLSRPQSSSSRSSCEYQQSPASESVQYMASGDQPGPGYRPRYYHQQPRQTASSTAGYMQGYSTGLQYQGHYGSPHQYQTNGTAAYRSSGGNMQAS